MNVYELVGIILGVSALFFGLRTPAALESYAKANAISAERINELVAKYEKLEKRMSYTWVYMIQLIETLRKHNITTPPPPDELKSDPDIIRLFEGMRGKRRKKK